MSISPVHQATRPTAGRHAAPLTHTAGLPTVAVVICCYTEARWDDLCAAIGSVIRQGPEEVLLVVDHNDTLLRRAEHAVHDGRFAGVRVLPNHEGRGLSGARNTGVAASTADVVAFLDDDAAAAAGWLDALRHAYDDDEVQGVGGAVIPNWLTARPAWFPAEFDWVVGCTHSGMPRSRTGVRNFVGANMSLRRDALTSLNGFRTELGRTGSDVAGCEETELCIRASRLTSGSWLRYEPAATVVHNVPGDRASFRYFIHRCLGEGRSKATVSRLVGTTSGLASERAYLSRTIPAGIARGVRDACRGDLTGLSRAAAIVAGVLATVTGFAGQRIHQGWR